MSYLQLYIYRIKKENRTKFLDNIQKAKLVYQKYGAEGEELFLLHEKTPKYGVTGMWDIIPLESKEELWIGICRFKDKEHCENVMKKVDEDPETEILYEQFVNSVCEASRVIRGEFERIN
ncbi:MAG: DUF1428 family protein [Candidatus Hermodarchaeota archaeon]